MIRRVFLVFLLFGIVGCGSVDVTDPGSVAGTYPLRTLNGDELPAVLLQVGTTFLLEITAGSLTLNADQTCSITLTLRETEDGTVTTAPETAVCTYTLNSGAIALDLTGSDFQDTLGGVISGSTITITDDEGEVFVFKK